MSDPSVLEDVDSETMYQGKTPVGTRMPWDIGEPQPALVALEDAGEIRGDVLDVGCGLGDNAAFLASRGHRVTAIDEAPTAIEEARRRAGGKGDITFAVADAMKLDGYEDSFDTVIDSALYHNLTDEQRATYVAALHRAARPGARLHILSFSDAMPEEFPECFRVTEQNLRGILGASWTITALERTAYTSAMTREVLPQFVRLLSNQDIDEETVRALPVDEQGRLRLPIWRLTATRA
ncbi:class I SAM-dependent methyltransferase [Streptomyces sp. 6N223]|uniref:class I SAM-dependent methyltransferase n=1 Tax=Streptomyces sp. 6N223 TaxID=3457412 RepID=UPI003FD67F00